MIDVSKLKIGDSVWWLDSDNEVLEHTFLGIVGDTVVVSGETMQVESKSHFSDAFLTGEYPLVDHNISVKVNELADCNEHYFHTYPVSFVRPEHLYETKQEADTVMYANMHIEE